MVREPVVRGQFYPGTREGLLKALEGMIPVLDSKVEAMGAVCPHAGYMYSGSVAGEVYGRLSPKDTYIVLGPNHTGYGKRFALCRDVWQTPLGKVNIDEGLASCVLKRTGLIVEDRTAHVFEHSIEVQLPFIQRTAPNAKILPIVLGQGKFTELEDIANSIAHAVKNIGTDAVIIASSDMSHYLSRKIAKEKDGLAIDTVLNLDAKGLFKVVKENDISMCGYVPAVVMLMVAKIMGAEKSELIKYSDSGEITGDINEVVGYAGIIVS